MTEFNLSFSFRVVVFCILAPCRTVLTYWDAEMEQSHR